MKNKEIKIFCGAASMLLAVSLMSSALAEETIIQQEKLSYERCLKVITTSQDKLSVAPEITMSGSKAYRHLQLDDGTLTIKCDGIDGNVTVSTNTN